MSCTVVGKLATLLYARFSMWPFARPCSPQSTQHAAHNIYLPSRASISSSLSSDVHYDEQLPIKARLSLEEAKAKPVTLPERKRPSPIRHP